MRDKKILIFIITLTVFILVLIGIIIAFNARTSSNQPGTQAIFPTPVPLIYKSTTVESVVPPISSVLLAGQKQTFSVNFNTQVSTGSFKILLTSKAFSDSAEKEVSIPFTTSITSSGKTLAIQTTNNILPSHSYALIILDSKNRTLLSASYSSGNVEISTAPGNNPELKQYLPYETSTYKLTYNERRNTYIFNLKINSNSQESLIQQFENAKKQAEDFIKSKGIDINSIVIDWRHS